MYTHCYLLWGRFQLSHHLALLLTPECSTGPWLLFSDLNVCVPYIRAEQARLKIGPPNFIRLPPPVSQLLSASVTNNTTYTLAYPFRSSFSRAAKSSIVGSDPLFLVWA